MLARQFKKNKTQRKYKKAPFLDIEGKLTITAISNNLIEIIVIMARNIAIIVGRIDGGLLENMDITD